VQLFKLLTCLLLAAFATGAIAQDAEGPPERTRGGTAQCSATGTGDTLCTRQGRTRSEPGAAAEGPTGPFGAIAVSTQYLDWGAAWNREHLEEAKDDALVLCERAGCEVATWVRDGCAALATGNDGWGASWDEELANAAVGALEACSQYTTSCTLDVSFCSGE
jgi:hypothetical protein